MIALEEIVLKRLGTRPYAATLQAMREFTTGRSDTTPDEIWILEHPRKHP